MLTVSNGWFNRNISQQRVRQVTAAGYASPTVATPDTSRNMGAIDRCIDNSLFDGAKRRALDHLFDMARHCRLAQIAAQSPDATTRQAAIDDNLGAFDRCRDQLNRLLCRTQVELLEEQRATPTASTDVAGHTDRAAPAAPRSMAPAPQGTFLVVRYSNQIAPLAVPITPLVPNDQCPHFTGTEQIHRQHLATIRRARAVRIGAHSFVVRISENDGPLVIGDDGRLATSLQGVLATLWIRHLREQALNRLSQISRAGSALSLSPTFLGLRRGPGPSQQEQQAKSVWHTRQSQIQRDFNRAVTAMQRPLDNERFRLARQLQAVRPINSAVIRAKVRLSQLEQRIGQLRQRQSQVDKNVQRIKAEFRALCILLSDCTTPRMADTLMLRVQGFCEQVSVFANSQRDVTAAARFNAMLDAQSRFFREFRPELRSQCSELLEPAATGELRSLAIDDSATEPQRATLTNLLKDPTSSWQAVAETMAQFKERNQELIKNRKEQRELAKLVANHIQCFSPDDQAGMCSNQQLAHSAPTFYRPETFSRLISLRKAQANLDNPKNHFSCAQLITMKNQISTHCAAIKREFRPLQRHARSLSGILYSPATHMPVKGLDGTFISHERWELEQRRKKFNSKADRIVDKLEVVRVASLDNYSTLKKQVETSARLRKRTADMHDKTKDYVDKLRSACSLQAL